MRRLLISFVQIMTALLPMCAASAESMGQQDTLVTIPTDTIRTTPRKHPWLAGMEIVGLNAALVVYNRIENKDKDWSHVNWDQISHNITHRYWAWDQDDLGVNAFRHPVHGSLFYLIARANGMSIGESSLYTLGGTWMWEMFCEAEKPSINDMVYTSVGGNHHR